LQFTLVHACPQGYAPLTWPFQQIWNGVRVSPAMPYTWLMRLPVLSAFREADRFAILGLVGAALLAGAAVDWLRYHARPLVIATADGHPRAVAYTSWVPATTRTKIAGHPFYAQLKRAESGIPLAPRRNLAGNQVTAADLAAARQDLRGLGIGWALVWTRHQNPPVDAFLKATGFRFDHRVDGTIVFRFAGS